MISLIKATTLIGKIESVTEIRWLIDELDEPNAIQMQAMFELCHHFCLSGTTKVASQSAKTNAGKRTISIDSETMILLKKWKEQQAVQHNIKVFNPLLPHQLVFPNKSNKFCRPGQPNDWYDMIVNKFNLKKRITLHEFRKTHVSLCAMAGMKLEDIMYRVGHKNSKMTKQVYNYFYPEREERSADNAKFIETEKYLF